MLERTNDSYEHMTYDITKAWILDVYHFTAGLYGRYSIVATQQAKPQSSSAVYVVHEL